MAKKQLGKALIQGMTEALDFAYGKESTAGVHVPEHIDVQAIRLRLKLTQEAFAFRYGFALKTLRNWEQGIREPTGPARILLMLLDKDAKAIEKMLYRDKD